jgi:hypothetical protein
MSEENPIVITSDAYDKLTDDNIKKLYSPNDGIYYKIVITQTAYNGLTEKQKKLYSANDDNYYIIVITSDAYNGLTAEQKKLYSEYKENTGINNSDGSTFYKLKTVIEEEIKKEQEEIKKNDEKNKQPSLRHHVTKNPIRYWNFIPFEVQVQSGALMETQTYYIHKDKAKDYGIKLHLHQDVAGLDTKPIPQTKGGKSRRRKSKKKRKARKNRRKSTRRNKR